MQKPPECVVDQQPARRGFGTSRQDMSALIRQEQGRRQLRALLLVGAASSSTTAVDSDYFDKLRDDVRKAVEAADSE